MKKEFVPDLQIVDNYAVEVSVTKPGEIRALFYPIVTIHTNGKMVWCKSRGEACFGGCKLLDSCPRPEGAEKPIEGKMIELKQLPIKLKKEIESQ